MSKQLLLLPLLLLIAASSQAASEFYCCQDNSGRRACSDTLPEQCRGRPYKVLDSGGNIMREVGPPLTAEERQQQAAENVRRKQQEEAAREQNRKDQALLDTYATLQDIDLSQRKAENDVNLAMAATQAKINVAMTKRKKLLDEAEFYRKKSLPPELDKSLRAVEHEIKVEQELLDVKKHDFELIRAKYDADRQRYLDLTTRRRPLPPTGGATDSRQR
ncbi:MAG: DUF4124 domain-containing protein [Azonexus sp.]